MTDLVRFDVPRGQPVVVVVDDAGEGAEFAGQGDDSVLRATHRFTDRLDAVRDAVGAALVTLRGSLRPDEVTVSFGVSFTAEAGAVLAKAASEGHLTVEMVWQAASPDPDTEP